MIEIKMKPDVRIMLFSKGVSTEKVSTGEEVLATVDADTLEEADLSKLLLNNADLQGTILCKTIFSSASLTMADLRGADLTEAKLDHADLMAANLEKANLTNADLRKAFLPSVNLAGADLRHANIEEATFKYARYDKYTQWPEGTNPDELGAKYMQDKNNHS